MITKVSSENEMQDLGAELGARFHGGEIIELSGDVGAGKTTLAKGVAKGLGVSDVVQSPSYAISRLYEARDGLKLAHYDFYRLKEPGIMAQELGEAMSDNHTIVLIEWADEVSGLLPANRISIKITPLDQTSRQLEILGIEL